MEDLASFRCMTLVYHRQYQVTMLSLHNQLASANICHRQPPGTSRLTLSINNPRDPPPCRTVCHKQLNTRVPQRLTRTVNLPLQLTKDSEGLQHLIEHIAQRLVRLQSTPVTRQQYRYHTRWDPSGLCHPRQVPQVTPILVRVPCETADHLKKVTFLRTHLRVVLPFPLAVPLRHGLPCHLR